jgi:hypothetical protein
MFSAKALDHFLEDIVNFSKLRLFFLVFFYFTGCKFPLPKELNDASKICKL